MTNENIKDDGGPAFPIPIAGCNDGGVYNTLEQSCGKNGGMSLRDYFAARIMQSLLIPAFPQEACYSNDGIIARQNDIAMISYRLADAMLEARKK